MRTPLCVAAALLVLASGLLACAAPSAADDSAPGAVGPSALELRARDVADAIRKEPAWRDGLFDDAFRRNVPDAALRTLLANTFAAEGAVTSVVPVGAARGRAARFEFVCEKGGVLHCDLRLADAPDDRIRFLRTYGSLPAFADLADAARAMGELRGRVSFAVQELGGERRLHLAGRDAAEPLAVASAFKLYVLGALVDEIQSGRRRWSDTVPLDARLRSIPTGLLHRWPDGAPVTLHTLASLMIEQSDNTATDHLIFALGRAKVASMQDRMGSAHAALNRPMLSTGEMFRLKYADGGLHAREFVRRSEAERLAYLESVVDAIPIDRIDSPSERTPVAIETIGWFASADDLCAALDWLRRETESGPAAPARSILAIESGTVDPPDVLPYQGYKGGRLPGVASRNHLVRTAGGRWLAVSATWNDASADVDEPRLRRMVTRTLQLLARGR